MMSKKWRYEGAETHCHPIVVTRLDSLVYSIGGGQLPAAPPARARARRRGRRSREAATPNARHDARSRIVNVRETRTDGDAPVDARLRGARARARRSRGIYHYFALFYGETSTRDEPIPVPGRTFSGRAY